MKRFLEWLMEGQALRISPDMEQFAQEAIEKISQGQWAYGQPVYEREVDAGTYGKRVIKVVPHERKDSKGFGWADYATGELAIFANPRMGYSEAYVDFIIHELVHMFDPKLNNSKLRQAKWGIDAYDKSGKPLGTTSDEVKDAQYHTNPWEQDAFMAQTAREVIRHKRWFYDGDVNTIKTTLQKMQPDTPWEREWYKNPKMWRKYLNTIYQELIGRK